MFIEYLCKRFTLEKGHSLWLSKEQLEAGTPGPLNLKSWPFMPTVCNFVELEPCAKFFDAILVRADGLSFAVLAIKDRRNQPPGSEELTLEGILRVCDACQKYTGSVNSQQMPVSVAIVEVFAGTIPESDRQRLRQFRFQQTGGDRRACVGAWGVLPEQRELFCSLDPFRAFFQSRTIARYLREQALSDEAMLEQYRASGVGLFALLVGVALGVVLAYGSRHWLASMGATNAYLFGGADIFGSLVGLVIAIFARKIRRRSTLQGGLFAGLYCVALYGGFIVMGTAPGFWMLHMTLFVFFISLTIGGMSELA